ncbi:MAG: thioredoxin domain-containing protein [Pyrinomonadaceae bacterium]
MKRITAIAMSVAFILTFSAAVTFAQAKPTVAIIKADWCSACQKVEPIMMGLMKEYDGKVNFVMLDVTNDDTTAQAAAKAKSLGLTAFFEANKKTTSTVAVFTGKKQIYKTAMNYNKSDYVAAFDKALK